MSFIVIVIVIVIVICLLRTRMMRTTKTGRQHSMKTGDCCKKNKLLLPDTRIITKTRLI